MSNAQKEALANLDAYGHLNWVVGWSYESDDAPEDDDRGDWCACCDFEVFHDEEGNLMVAYHVVVDSDSGGFIDTLETNVVPADKAPFNLPAYWMDVGMEQVVWTESEYQEGLRINEDWNKTLRSYLEAEGYSSSGL